MLSAFKKWFNRDCTGAGKQVQFGNMVIAEDGHEGVCPDCGKTRPCDWYAILLPHRR